MAESPADLPITSPAGSAGSLAGSPAGSLAGSLARALERALGDPSIARLAARLPHRLLLVADESTLVAAPGNGSAPGHEVTAVASPEIWSEMLASLPRPGRQSVGAAMRADCGFMLSGDPLSVAQSMPLLEMLIEAMRAAVGASTPAPAPAPAAAAAPAAAPAAAAKAVDPIPAHEFVPPSPPLDRIASRYLRIDWPDGDHCWLFEESAGDPAQPVLLLMHTAGADSRQWHALMTDEALGRQWRMVAFDMPCHGRSRPPEAWCGDPWRLDAASYLACIRAWMRATDTPKVAMAGCSMGAAIGLALLARHPELVHGAILLEVPYRSPGRRTELLDHPAVHGGRFGAAWVQALLSPHSPAQHRRFATWIYSQAAPGVYEGDLEFYSDEFDAALYLKDIDAARTPLWLLSGDYDYSATPADGRRVAAGIPGAHFVEMAGLGHFPMTENPARLLEHFRPAVRALREHVAFMETTR